MARNKGAAPPQVWKGIPSRGDRLDHNLLIAQRFCLALGMQSPPVRRLTIKKTDTQIHHDVLEELKWDSRVDETEVGVQVAGGVVTLTGTVTSWAKRVAAQEAARRVIGVLDVANDTKVKVPGGLTRSDTEIAQAVRQALAAARVTPAVRVVEDHLRTEPV